MAIYDCFQYFDEDHIVELRLNILNKYVDYFVISESTKTHQGKSKKINFDINKFKKFKHKIKFVVADYKKEIDFKNHTGGESPVEQHQRNYLMEGIKDALPDDYIVLSDSDEIPDFTKIKDISLTKKYLAFSQKIWGKCAIFVWQRCRSYSVLPDRSVTRHEHFLSNIGDFWLFLEFSSNFSQTTSGSSPKCDILEGWQKHVWCRGCTCTHTFSAPLKICPYLGLESRFSGPKSTSKVGDFFHL